MLYIGKKRIICLVLSYCAVILWMTFIFFMSSQTGAESGNTSSGLIAKLCSIIISDFNDLDEAQKGEVISSFSYPIRKLAHFTEYFILSVFICVSIIQTKKENKLSLSSLALSFVCGILYAVSDEVHQFFVPGRAGTATDVFIDGAGVVLGCFAVGLLYKLVERQKSNSAP